MNVKRFFRMTLLRIFPMPYTTEHTEHKIKSWGDVYSYDDNDDTSDSKLFLARFFETLLHFMNNANICNSAKNKHLPSQDRTIYKSFFELKK